MSDESPNQTGRESLATATLVELIDTLVDDFDVIDALTMLTTRSVQLLGASAAGILLADTGGHLRVMAASTERIDLLELFQIQNEQGPCIDSYRTGEIVANPDLTGPSPWPQFAAESLAAGFPSVCAVPLRLRKVILGCLNLFMSEPIPLTPADVSLAQALADVASIAIIQSQSARDAAVREGHLQHALDSRIVIEQAKGMLAQYAGYDMDEAFNQLRKFARDNNRGLSEIAESLGSGELPIDTFRINQRPVPIQPPTHRTE